MSGSRQDPIIIEDDEPYLAVTLHDRFRRNETIREGGAVMNAPRWVDRRPQPAPVYHVHLCVDLVGSFEQLRMLLWLLALAASYCGFLYGSF